VQGHLVGVADDGGVEDLLEQVDLRREPGEHGSDRQPRLGGDLSIDVAV
jgi:hypothetical protein